MNIIGVDAVGEGSLISSIVVCAVKAPENWRIDGLNDSKKLSDKKRRVMNEVLRQNNDIEFVIEQESNERIDELGLGVALKICYDRAIKQLYDENTYVIIDGGLNFDGFLKDIKYKTVIKADSLYPTVMSASILAKVFRDDLVIGLSKEFPKYSWEKCKGYLSSEHKEAIKKFGLTEHHRKSYKIKL